MTVGSPEWVQGVAVALSEEANPQLIAIAENAAKRHGLAQVKLRQEDIIRVGMTLSETQDQSFILGIQLGISICLKAVDQLEREP